MPLRLVALSTLLFAAACGDDGTFIDAAPQPVDSATIDSTSPFDAPPADAAVDADTTVPDAAITPDAVAVDATTPDATTPDATTPDALIADASTPDATAADAFVPPDADLSADASTTPDAGVAAGHLLITEVTTAGGGEFVEIYNPTGQTISLRDYYLADNQTYFQYPAHVASNVTLTFDASDFLARFPVGASIAPGATITVATDAMLFETAYTAVPTYTIQELGNSTAMELLLTGASSPNPSFTNTGEMVVLFYWDGATDLVSDVDIMVAGNAPTAVNTLTMKTAVDGPDADALPTAYAVDALTIGDTATDAASGFSHKRILAETGNETQAGTGNGITGDDETSEAIRTTWDSMFTAPTPGATPFAG